MDLFVTHAAALARDVEQAASRRAFRSAIEEFERLLARVSDYPRDFLTDGDVDALAALADAVVERIEQRLEARADRLKVQRELAERIYKVRVDVETLYMVLRQPPCAAPAPPGPAA